MQQIIFIIPSLIDTGPTRVVFNIIQHLNRNKYQPVLLVLSLPDHQDRYCKHWFSRFHVRIIEYSYTKWELQIHTREIAKKIQEENPCDSIFHAHGYYPVRLLSFFENRKVMCTIHNLCMEDFIYNKGYILGKYMAIKYLQALKKIPVNVAISKFVENWYKKYDDAISITTVYNGVKVGEVPSKEERRRIRLKICEQLQISEVSHILLYPAAFNELKNHKYLIKELKQNYKQDFVILFAGQGRTEKECKRLTKNDKRFQFLGYKMDLEEYWLSADFLITPSCSEGFGLILAEALLHGVPCIASNIPVHEEIITSIFGEGHNMTFSLKSKGHLCDVIEKNIKKEFDFEYIRSKANHLYSAEAMAKGYEKLYNSIKYVLN